MVNDPLFLLAFSFARTLSLSSLSLLSLLTLFDAFVLVGVDGAVVGIYLVLAMSSRVVVEDSGLLCNGCVRSVSDGCVSLSDGCVSVSDRYVSDRCVYDVCGLVCHAPHSSSIVLSK